MGDQSTDNDVNTSNNPNWVNRDSKPTPTREVKKDAWTPAQDNNQGQETVK